MAASSGVAGSGSSIFDREAARYDAWFDSPDGRVLFRTEVDAVRRLLVGLPGPWLEVGVGTGRFAEALGVPFGVDPARGALHLARRRGIRVALAQGEALPFPDRRFGAVLLIVTLCFAEPHGLLVEIRRVLSPAGGLIVADILRDSPWGHRYLRLKEADHPFYRHATFYGFEELEHLLAEAGLVTRRVSSAITPASRRVSNCRAGVRRPASGVVVCMRSGTGKVTVDFSCGGLFH